MRKTAGGVVTVLFCTLLFAQDDFPRREQEDDVLSIQLGFYGQNDNSDKSAGNPFVDEDLTVFEGIILLDKTMSERDRMKLWFVGDLLSSASITGENNPMFRALQSNPSGNKHGELGFGWVRDFGEYKLGGNISVGAEFSNYWSSGWGLNLEVPLPSGNTLFNLNYQGYVDAFEIKLFNGLEPGWDQRYSHSLEGDITQVLTPRTIAKLTLTHIEQSGYLGTTWHSVLVNGLKFSEMVPRSRRRDAVTLRVKQAFSEYNAVELGYRYYDDSWDIKSNTYELRFFQYLNDKRLLVEPNYRLYDQTAAFFYGTEFPEVSLLMSSDSDLSAFDGRSFGLRGTLIEPAWLPGWKADLALSFDYYSRSDGLDFFWATLGYRAKF